MASVAKERFRFIGNIIAELKKVIWLSRREAGYLTLMVVVVSIAAAFLLGLTDLGFSTMIQKLFLGR